MDRLMQRVILLAMLFLGACSLETAIETLSSPEDRQFAQDAVRHIREGNEAWLRERFGPDMRGESQAVLAQARSLYPPGGETRLVGFNSESRYTSGTGSLARKEFVLVTQGEGRWVVTVVETRSTGGPFLISGLRVTPHRERPPELIVYEVSERMVPFFWALGTGFLLVLVGILIAFIRYRRRKREQFRS